MTVFSRDPWWVFTTVNLFWNVKSRYGFSVFEVLRISPRLAILMSAMCLSICFLVVDILSVTSVLKSVLPTGINPFWRVSGITALRRCQLLHTDVYVEQLSFIFKCLTDSIILDDFKVTLDRLRDVRLGREGVLRADGSCAREFSAAPISSNADERSKPEGFHIESVRQGS